MFNLDRNFISVSQRIISLNISCVRFFASKYASKKVTNYKLDQKAFQYGKYGGLIDNDKNLIRSSKLLTEKISDFSQLKIMPEVRSTLKLIISSETLLNRNLISNDVSLNDKSVVEFAEQIKPTPIQINAIQNITKKLMDNKLQVHLIAGETGTGKTMGYLFPLINYLKRQEIENIEEWESLKDKAIIRSIILVPTHELVEQVYQTVMKVEPKLGLRTHKWASGSSYHEFLESLKNRIDILVTTPGKILSLFKIKMIHRPDRILSRVKFLVMDEADTLMDQSWVEDSYQVIKHMTNANHLVFCSATIPAEFEKTMNRIFPTLNVIVSPSLHKINKKVNFKILNASLNPYKGSKMKVLAQTLYAIMRDNSDKGYEKRCVVFVNEKTSVMRIVETLRNQYGHDVQGLTGDDTIEERLSILAPFIQLPKILHPTKTESKPSKKSSNIKIPNSNILIESKGSHLKDMETGDLAPLKVLVTTDLLARGMNFRGVSHVVLYDVPNTSVDLVHRSGRTGRMSQKGIVYMIIDKHSKSWAKGVPRVVRGNIPIQ